MNGEFVGDFAFLLTDLGKRERYGDIVGTSRAKRRRFLLWFTISILYVFTNLE